jgi:hypothetical protein
VPVEAMAEVRLAPLGAMAQAQADMVLAPVVATAGVTAAVRPVLEGQDAV